MSNYFTSVINVAKWEFDRYFKIMDLLKGILWMAIFGLIGGLFGSWLLVDSSSIPEIAVSEYGVFSPENFEDTNFTFVDRSDISFEQIQQELEEGKIDGILTIISADEAELWIPSERGWVFLLNEWLNDKRTDLKLNEFQLERFQLEDLEAGMEIITHHQSNIQRSRTDLVMAGGSIVLVLMAVFLGFGSLFAGITGEKQQRITEQITSAISPSVWIDGKILGISAVGMAYVLVYGVLTVLGGIVFLYYSGASASSLIIHLNVPLILTFVVFVLLGVLMFNSFFAGVASIIDDPNTSEKSGLMFLPIMPVFLSFAVLINPDSLPMQVMGILPITSFAVQPARMVMTSVPIWEILIAIFLLAASVWFLRFMAGRIFSAGMLMY